MAAAMTLLSLATWSNPSGWALRHPVLRADDFDLMINRWLTGVVIAGPAFRVRVYAPTRARACVRVRAFLCAYVEACEPRMTCVCVRGR